MTTTIAATEQKFSDGQAVYALEAPDVALVIRRYVYRIYYCRIAGDPDAPELVYFERDLVALGNPARTQPLES